jgi:fatty-acid peroxygenase
MGLNDRTAALMRTGYRFSGWLRAKTSGSGRATPLRLLGRRPLVVSGREGVELFYDTDRVRRRSAIPRPLASTIYGGGAVHSLDGDAHLQRKQLFLEVTSPELEADLAESVAAK